MGPVARDALLRAVARRLGAAALAHAGIPVPEEPQLGGGLNLRSASVSEDGLPEAVASVVAEIRAGQADAPMAWLGEDEQVAIVSAAHATAWLLEAARLRRGVDDLAALVTEGRSDAALMQLARLLTGR